MAIVLSDETGHAFEVLSRETTMRPALALKRTLVEPDFARLREEPAFRRLLGVHAIAAARGSGNSELPLSAAAKRRPKA